MKNRIDLKFQELKELNKKAMIAFVTSGYPDINTTEDIILKIASSGSDIIELGIPYSDPIADGPIIQTASAKALKNGIKIDDIMGMVSNVRKKTEVPLVYMTYFGNVYKYGVERFMKSSKEVGTDGVIIPDLPVEERSEIVKVASKYGVHIIPLVAPTSENRIKSIVKEASGFIYCVSTNGVTGMRSKLAGNLEEYISLVSKYTEVPKCIGFGVSNAEMAKNIKSYCDGVIIGSAIMKIIEEETDKEKMLNKVGKFVYSIKEVL